MNEPMNPWELRVHPAAQALGLTFDDLNDRLRGTMGVTTIEMLDDDDVFKFGDFREEFKDKPIGSLRMAFKFLRPRKDAAVALTGEGEDPRTAQLKALGLKVKLEDADTSTLLKLYVPDKPSDPVSNALKKRFGDKPVLAFKDDGTLAVDESCQYIADVEQGYPEADAITVDGKLAKLYPIGTKPNVMVEEDPLFPGRPLRNGCSVVNNRNWKDVAQPTRQFCRIIATRGDIDINNKDAVLRLLERATGPQAGSSPDEPAKALTEAYEEAYMEFRELRQRGELPKLRVALGSTTSKPNNPFGVRRQY